MNLATLIPLLLKISIGLSVFTFGLQVKFEDIALLYRKPALLFRSLLSISIIMPLFALFLFKVMDLTPVAGVSLLAISLSPIPPMLPNKVKKVGGNTSYIFSLLVILALLSVVIILSGTWFFGSIFHKETKIEPLSIEEIMLIAILLPLAAGMLFEWLFPETTRKIRKPVSSFANILLLLCLLPILIKSLPAVFSMAGKISLFALLGFIIMALVVGHLLGGPDEENRTVLALATATRHPGVAIVLASANLPDQPYVTATIMLYLLLNFVVSSAYIAWRK